MRNEYWFFSFSFFSLTVFSVGFLHCSFGSEGIDIGLTISGFLLLFSEALDFFFFFVFEALGFSGLFSFFSEFFIDIINNFLFLFFNLKRPLLLHQNSLLISIKNLIQHFLGLDLFLDSILSLLLLHLLIRLNHQLSFLLNLLLSPNPLQLSLLNLLDNHLMVNFLFNFMLSFSFLSRFNGLESIDLNHEVLLFLLFNVSVMDHFLLGELFISDCDDLGVHNHFIHFLDIVSVFISQIVGLLDDFHLLFTLLFLLLGSGDVFLLGFSNTEHSLFFGNSSG